MKNSIEALLVSTVLISFTAFSCSSTGDSESELVKEGGPLEFSELAGTWEATSARFISVVSDDFVDVIADGGSLSLTVQSSGRCTFAVDPFDRAAYTASGEMFWGLYVDEDDDDEEFEALVIVWDDSPDDRSYFRWFELTNTAFDLSCTSECGEYDFNNNGTSETSDLSFEFMRS